MEQEKILALELTKAFLMNSNVKPVYNRGSEGNESEAIFDDLNGVNYSFGEIVNHFLDNINNIERFY